MSDVSKGLGYAVKQNSTVEYLYKSEMNCVRLYVDHFIILS